MSTIRTEPLQPDERVRLLRRTHVALPVTAFFAIFAAILVAIPVGLALLSHPALPAGPTVLLMAVSLALGSVLVFTVTFWQSRRLSCDLKRNQKIVLDTSAERVDERYFRGVSTYYLSIADERLEVPHRRFQIDKETYAQLKRGEHIRIAFLPVSGRVLAIDGTSCRYRF